MNALDRSSGWIWLSRQARVSLCSTDDPMQDTRFTAQARQVGSQKLTRSSVLFTGVRERCCGALVVLPLVERYLSLKGPIASATKHTI